MAQIDVSHDCEHGEDAGPVGGAVAVHEKAESNCCQAVLAEGGNDADGYTCTACGRPTTKVMGPPTAHWKCKCGTRRSQVITSAADYSEEG